MRPFYRLWLLASAATMILLALVALAAPAYAQVAPNGDVSPDTPVSAWLTVNNALVVVITGALVPIVNGFLLRPENPQWVKGLVANLMGVAAHAFSQAVQDDGTAILSQEWLTGLALTLISMVASYMGFWRPVANINTTAPTVLPVGDLLARADRTAPRAA